MDSLEEIIQSIPSGYSEAVLMGRKYGITRQDFNQGKSIKVYAEELGGTDFISFNYYKASSHYLKPCEMPEQKVLSFLKEYQSQKH